MDDLQSNEGSGYINVDLQPPSPRTAPIEIFDFDYTTGSPFSDNSDLSFTADHQLGPIFDTYDPNDFDGPNSASSLLMFNDYYRSPSPSGSDNNDDNRSRASSASSTHTNFQSPNMGVSHSFEGLSFNSPNWQTDPLPPHKPPSPPRLQIDHHQPGIIINAPEDQNNSDLGPQLHIVPATPVSGGAGVVNIASSSPWLAPNSNSDPSSRSPSPVHSSATTPGPSRSPSVSPQPPSSPFLYPQQLRSRSKSDTSLEPPNWDTIAASDNLMQQHHQQQQQAYPATLGSNFTFGTPSQAPNHSSNDFLSPNNFDFQSVTQLRRSRSDVGNAPLNRHRTSRSEDYRFTNTNDNGFLNPNGSSQNMLFPPTSHEDFMRQQLQQQQYLSPSNVRVPELIPTHPTHHHSASLGSHPRGHYRSASGGSRPRSERGSSAGWDGGLDVGSARASPYPSPHASPRGRILSLEREDAFDFASMENNGSQNDDGGSGMGVGLGGAQTGGGGGGIVAVSKPNVTTGRTANASQRRRKQEATFVCPVQGCGSTFTRSFNLKGHIRSHNEEKPFQCHWPGCGKGFARQHDCKRHEQLHTNYRPFNCEGCGKQFARMDALNRHLKSEGGAECSKQVEASSPPDSAASNVSNVPNAPSSAKSSNGNGNMHSPQLPNSGFVQQYGLGGGGGVKVKMDEGHGQAWGVGLSVAL